MIYLPSKKDGIYEYVGLDWDTGDIKARWPFPDDSRKWNAYGGITALLEDGDLLIGGVFAIKRVNVGNGNSCLLFAQMRSADRVGQCPSLAAKRTTFTPEQHFAF